MRLVASDHGADFVYAGRVVPLSSAWRAVKGTGIAVRVRVRIAKAAANIDLNLESLEGNANANKSNFS